MTAVRAWKDQHRPTVRTWLEPADWVTALDEFTARNAGRHVRLELDDPSLGAQIQRNDEAILDVAYLPRDARIDVTLGEQDGGNRRHVRSIGGVTSVDLLTGSSGRDLVLRIAHGHGRVQTLLTLLD